MALRVLRVCIFSIFVGLLFSVSKERILIFVVLLLAPDAHYAMLKSGIVPLERIARIWFREPW